MRIQRIRVEGLFQQFTHDIRLRMDDRITIIHGPNGYGKTITLKLVDGLFNSRYTQLRSVPFHELTVCFDNETVLHIRQIAAKRQRDSAGSLSLEFELGSSRSMKGRRTFRLEEPKIPAGLPASMIEDYITGLDRIGANRWVHSPTGRKMTLNEVCEEFSDELPFIPQPAAAIPDWFKEMQSSIDVRLVLNPAYPDRAGIVEFEESSLISIGFAY